MTGFRFKKTGVLLLAVCTATAAAFVFLSSTAFADSPAPLSSADLKKVTSWIAHEVADSRQPYCYRDSYGRGVGKPMICAAGLAEGAGLC